MNPPEKVYLHAKGNYIGAGVEWILYRSDKADHEYHLAPQWHDAVKDPPKNGVFAVRWINTGDYWEKGEFSNGSWWDVVEDEKYNPQPNFYYSLPEPPKESRE